MSTAASIAAPRTPSSVAVDADVASYIFKWHPELAQPYLEMTEGARLIISFATAGEMEQGALQAEWGSRRIARGDEWTLADAWIAATARFLGVPLVTNNARHYRHLEGLEILSLS